MYVFHFSVYRAHDVTLKLSITLSRLASYHKNHDNRKKRRIRTTTTGFERNFARGTGVHVTPATITEGL